MRIKKKGVYLIEFENGFKIGMSGHLYERIDSYKHPWSVKIISIYILECQFPRMVETKIKQHFKDKLIKKNQEFILSANINEILEAIMFYRFTRPKYLEIRTEYIYKKLIKVFPKTEPNTLDFYIDKNKMIQPIKHTVLIQSKTETLKEIVIKPMNRDGLNF